MKDLLHLARQLNSKPRLYKTHISYHPVEKDFIVYCLDKWQISHTDLVMYCVDLCMEEQFVPVYKKLGEPNRVCSLGISTLKTRIVKIDSYCTEHKITRRNKFIRDCVRAKLTHGSVTVLYDLIVQRADRKKALH